MKKYLSLILFIAFCLNANAQLVGKRTKWINIERCLDALGDPIKDCFGVSDVDGNFRPVTFDYVADLINLSSGGTLLENYYVDGDSMCIAFLEFYGNTLLPDTFCVHLDSIVFPDATTFISGDSICVIMNGDTICTTGGSFGSTGWLKYRTNTVPNNTDTIYHKGVTTIGDSIGTYTGQLNVIGRLDLRYPNALGQDIAIGKNTLLNSTGVYNTVIGWEAMMLNTIGNFNIAIGTDALRVNTIGSSNFAIGAGALSNNLSGSGNLAFGTSSLSNNITGSNNIAIGNNAGVNLLGSGNVFIGYDGILETGSNKLAIETDGGLSPLIYGDFSTNELTINGKLGFTNNGGTATSMIGFDGNFLTTFSAGYGLNFASGILEVDTFEIIGGDLDWYKKGTIVAPTNTDTAYREGVTQIHDNPLIHSLSSAGYWGIVEPIQTGVLTNKWLFSQNSVANAGARNNHVISMGWNIGTGGGAHYSGLSGIGLSFEDHYEPTVGDSMSEYHTFFIDGAGAQHRLESYTIRKANKNAWENYYTLDKTYWKDPNNGNQWLIFERGNTTSCAINMLGSSTGTGVQLAMDAANTNFQIYPNGMIGLRGIYMDQFELFGLSTISGVNYGAGAAYTYQKNGAFVAANDNLATLGLISNRFSDVQATSIHTTLAGDNTDNIFTVDGSGEIRISKFPNTRDDGTPVNFIGTDAAGLLQSYPVTDISNNIKLNDLLGADAANTIDNLNNTQTWQWNSLGSTGTAFSLSSNSASAGAARILDIDFSGAGTGAGYALRMSNTRSGAASVNYGIHTTVSGGLNTNTAIHASATGTGSTNTYGIRAFGNGGLNGGIGVQGENSNGTGYPLRGLNSGTATSTILPGLWLARETSGTPANGLGISLRLTSETTTGTDIGNIISSHLTDATGATATSQLTITGANNNSATTLLTISGAGIFTLAQSLQDFADDTAAAAGGIPINGLYRNGSIVMIRIN